MIKSMLSIADESGWLPKWELNATETTTMVGDPAGLVITDSYLKGIRGFDIEKAYKYMCKSAVIYPNPLRPGLKSYLEKGYIPSNEITSGSVSVTQEYNAADFALAQLAKTLGKTKDFKIFLKRSKSYRFLLIVIITYYVPSALMAHGKLTFRQSKVLTLKSQDLLRVILGNIHSCCL